MKNKLLKCALFAATAVLAGNAYAVNWGATVAYSNAEVEEDDFPALDGEIDYLSIGGTLDTSNATGVFGYRGTLALVFGDYEVDNGGDADYDGVAVNNTFGFRVGGNLNQRYWIGPAIDVQLVEFDGDSIDGDALSVGIGASFGADFYQPTGQFFSLETGFRIGEIVADLDNDDSFDDDDLELESTGFFIRGSFFFSGGPSR